MDHQENVNHGAGQAVNITIGLGPTIILAVLAFAVIAVLVFTTRSSVQSEMKAQRAEEKANYASANLSMASYWMQSAYVACNNAGVKTPSIPAHFMKH